MARLQLENEGTHNVLLDLPIIEHTIRLGLDGLLLHMQGVVYITTCTGYVFRTATGPLILVK